MKKIAIIPNTTKKGIEDVISRIKSIISDRAEILSQGDMQGADFAIVLGGDGSIIRAARNANGIPLVGINLGHVGFMSEIDSTSIDNAIENLILGKYEIEKRMMLSAVAFANGEQIDCGTALNDIVVTKNDGAKLIASTLYSNNEFIKDYVSDGIIVSTPTGSTGYGLSAGGPVILPTMQLMSITAICPHMLSTRPIIIPDDSELRIELNDSIDINKALVVVDGKIMTSLNMGDSIKICKSEVPMNLIKLGSTSFYNVLLNKLG